MLVANILGTNIKLGWPKRKCGYQRGSLDAPCAGIESVFETRESDVKGDRIEIVIDLGDGTRTYEVSATRAGRRVDVATRRGLVEVSELTRNGTPVRTARFMASRIVALVEHPAADRAAEDTPS
jgi:hypothetical protein